MTRPTLGGYYLTAEPVGQCSCHYCRCDGCAVCGDHEDEPAEHRADDEPDPGVFWGSPW